MVRSLSSPAFKLSLTATLRNTLSDGTVATAPEPNCSESLVLSNGVGDNQANRGWMSENLAIASGAQETLDIYDLASTDIGAGAGRDGVGQLIVYEEIVGIVIVNENLVTAAGQLEILPASSEGWTPIGTHTVATGGALPGQGVLCKFNPSENGFDIDEATSHRITMRAVGGAVTRSIYLLARHDDAESTSSSSSASSASSSSLSSSSPSSLSSISTSSESSSSVSTSSVSTSSSSISTSSDSSSPSSASSESSSASSESSISTSSESSSSSSP